MRKTLIFLALSVLLINLSSAYWLYDDFSSGTYEEKWDVGAELGGSIVASEGILKLDITNVGGGNVVVNMSNNFANYSQVVLLMKTITTSGVGTSSLFINGTTLISNLQAYQNQNISVIRTNATNAQLRNDSTYISNVTVPSFDFPLRVGHNWGGISYLSFDDVYVEDRFASISLISLSNNAATINSSVIFDSTIEPGVGLSLTNATINIYRTNGTLWNSTTNYGYASFDGYGDYIQIYNITNTTSGMNESYSYWVKPVGTSQGPIQAHFIAWNGSSNPRISTESTTSGSNLVRCIVSNASGAAILTTSQVTLPYNEWSHVVCNMYYNGSLLNVTTYVNGRINVTANLNSHTTGFMPMKFISLGTQKFNFQQRFFNGSLDEFRYYNKSLSQSEITQLYNLGRVEAPNVTDGLNLWLTLNELNQDASGHGFNLTVVNNTYYTVPRSWNITTNAIGNFLWGVVAGVHDGINGFSQSSRENYSFAWGGMIDSSIYNSTAYKTAREAFTSNISISSGYALASAYLVWNNVHYGATIAGNVLSRAFDIPSVGTNEMYWRLIYSTGEELNLSLGSQSVAPVSFGLCNASLTIPYYNFTFKDESTLAVLNASITSSTFSYYLGEGEVNQTYDFTNLSENSNYTFCFNPNNWTVNVDYYMQYKSGTYPQRISNPESESISNSTTNRVLYLLGADDGIYVTFQVINSAEQPLSGVSAVITRVIGGETITISTGVTGSDGGVTFWLNPDYQYTATFTKEGYDTYSATQAFTNTEYTINLGGSTSTTSSDYQKGITYSIRPGPEYLTNGTYYIFNFTIDSSSWTLDSFGFNISNEDGLLVASNSSTASQGGTVSVNITTGENESFRMTYYWVINGSTTQAVRSWRILDTSGNSFSVARWISDFTTYVGLGIFGLTDFGIGILCFVVIVVITGTLKLKYGISDEAALLGVVFALVAFFDVSLGLLPNPIGAVDNFPTIIMGVIFAGFLFKEVYQ